MVTEIADVKDLAQTMSAAISLFTEQQREAGGLAKAELIEFLSGVALPGSQVWSYLVDRLPAAVRKAKRLQVVEAAIGATLPIELFYRRPAPVPGATWCEGGPPDGDRPCSKCPDEAHAPEVVCLNQFWGCRTVVERRGLRQNVPPGAVATLKAVESASAPPLHLGAAIFGTSDIVDSGMPPGTPAEQLPSAQVRHALGDLVGAANVTNVGTLADWEDAVRTTSPGLIVFLVHKTKFAASEAIQLGSSIKVAEGHILEKHVVGPKGIHPIVVLMGCSTGLPKADVLGFVPWLTHQGASAVVSTLSPVLGRYAGPALAKLVAMLAKKRGTGTLGEAILEVKRQLIEEGEPIGMCLVTFGEADLRL